METDFMPIVNFILFIVGLITWTIFLFMAHDIGRIKKYLKEIKQGKGY